jgi:UPF0755 protein
MKPNFHLSDGKDVYIYVYEDSDFGCVTEQLDSADCVINLSTFEKAARLRYGEMPLRPGRYKIDEGMSNRMLINRLVGGAQSPVSLRINNILTPQQLAHRLDVQLMADSMQFIRFMEDDEFLKRYGVDSLNVLSMFIPNTYEVYWTITPEDFFDRMYKEYQAFWNADGRSQKAEQIGLTRLDVSILASIVDSESNVKREKPTIAGVYMNRLKRGMPLQSDPTVKFAVGDFSLIQILYAHLGVESPYNTYKYAGLPPGPIRMPSIEGLDAVLNYERHNYLYMCAKETLNGEHGFAVTLTEHNRNAARYHAALRAWKRQRKNEILESSTYKGK